jgi:hypothetical protein
MGSLDTGRENRHDFKRTMQELKNLGLRKETSSRKEANPKVVAWLLQKGRERDARKLAAKNLPTTPPISKLVQ